MPKFKINFKVTEVHEQQHTVNANSEHEAIHQAVQMFKTENKDLKENCEVEVTCDGE